MVLLARLWRRGVDRGGDDANAQAFDLPQFQPSLDRAGDRTGRKADRHRAGADVQGVLRQLRLRGQRFAGQDGVVLQQRPRPAREEENHLAPSRLSRRDRGERQPDRHSAQSPGLRPADRQHPARRLPALRARRRARRNRRGVRHPHGRQPRPPDHGRGPRDRRRVHRRAGDGGGRGDRAARDLLRQGPGGAGQA